jgi:hypothetical protein
MSVQAEEVKYAAPVDVQLGVSDSNEAQFEILLPVGAKILFGLVIVL